MTQNNFLEAILRRKRREIERRRVWYGRLKSSTATVQSEPTPIETIYSTLRRSGADRPKVIAEIKLRSPSAGTIRKRTAGAVTTIARSYVQAGASAVSVLCDRPGFGGTPLDVRRVASAVAVPILFKEFVLDEIQIWLAKEMGASLVLLLASALSVSELQKLVVETIDQGLAPVVEIANEKELGMALATRTKIIGVNARDLWTFRVDAQAAMRLIERIPDERIAIYMSGVSSRQGLKEIAETRADAVLIGSALMRAPSPGEKLKQILG